MLEPPSTDARDSAGSGSYEVLARKYRPARFDSLIGQETLVRTLENAFETNRIAQAFILTGIRGVGKTTTARIIARGLNCTGTENGDRPTVHPCGRCESCVSIQESRHVDIIEIDAASHTGVDYAREITNEAQTLPSYGRFRVFIIDEVHMLSRSAFNALLKVVEEPPQHTKFIFATTEIRKVPVTILSRCQRFDLRRVASGPLTSHLKAIADSENAEIEGAALALLVRASEGSVRDAVSLLDQAIAYREPGQPIVAENVRDMLGLADRARVFDLFQKTLEGDAAGTLAEFGAQFEDGIDPLMAMEDLAETCHFISVLRVAPELADNPALTEDERRRGEEFARKLSAPALVRYWQILASGLEEIRKSEHPRLAADMTLLRLVHAAQMPTPAELIARIDSGGPGAAGEPGPSGRRPAPADAGRPMSAPPRGMDKSPRDSDRPGGSDRPGAAAPPPDTAIRSAEDLARFVRKHGKPELFRAVRTDFRPVDFAPGKIRFEPGERAPRYFAMQLRDCLRSATGADWQVETCPGGGPTLREQEVEQRRQREDAVRKHPAVEDLKRNIMDGLRALEAKIGPGRRQTRPSGKVIAFPGARDRRGAGPEATSSGGIAEPRMRIIHPTQDTLRGGSASRRREADRQH